MNEADKIDVMQASYHFGFHTAMLNAGGTPEELRMHGERRNIYQETLDVFESLVEHPDYPSDCDALYAAGERHAQETIANHGKTAMRRGK